MLRFLRNQAIEKMKEEPEWARIAFDVLNNIDIGLYGDFLDIG